MENEYYLFHGRSNEFFGDVIYPLNQLKNINNDLYSAEAAKYRGREYLLERVIPILNCKWNDVIHLTAIQPTLIYQVLKSVGYNPPDLEFFKIHANLLRPENTVIFKYENETDDDTQFIEYTPDILAQFQQLNNSTITYYKNCFSKNKKPLLFVNIPHILTKQTISVRNLEIINWSSKY